MSDKSLNSLRKKVEEDPEFVYSPKDGNNIKTVLASADKELDNKRIAKLLLSDEAEVESIYNKIIEKMKNILTKKSF